MRLSRGEMLYSFWGRGRNLFFTRFSFKEVFILHQFCGWVFLPAKLPIFRPLSTDQALLPHTRYSSSTFRASPPQPVFQILSSSPPRNFCLTPTPPLIMPSPPGFVISFFGMTQQIVGCLSPRITGSSDANPSHHRLQLYRRHLCCSAT